MSTTTVLDSKQRSNLTTLLDLCALNISTMQFHVCLERVRIDRILEIRHSILEISLPEQVHLKHVVDTNWRIEYTVDRIVVITFKTSEHCRNVHGMLKIQDPHINRFQNTSCFHKTSWLNQTRKQERCARQQSHQSLWNKMNRHNQDELQWMTRRAEGNVINKYRGVIRIVRRHVSRRTGSIRR